MRLSTGLTIDSGIMGDGSLSPVLEESRNGDRCELTYGYDSRAETTDASGLERPLTREERRELAKTMISLWTQWAEKDPLVELDPE